MLSSLRSLQGKQTCPLPRVQEPDVIRLSYLAGECIRTTFWLLVTEAQVNIEAKGILWLMQLADLRMWQVSGVDGLCSLLSLASLAVHRMNLYQQVGSSSLGELRSPLARHVRCRLFVCSVDVWRRVLLYEQ